MKQLHRAAYVMLTLLVGAVAERPNMGRSIRARPYPVCFSTLTHSSFTTRRWT
jgi:hypothetical protein